jgi:lipid kinase YegS
VAELRDEGRNLDVRVTYDAPQVPEYAADSAGFDNVVAAGGDGMVNRVLSGLMRLDPGDRPALGIVPLGTANDFAAATDMPVQDLAQGLRLATSNEPAWVDVVRVGDWHFLNMLTAGAGSAATRDVSEVMKEVFGKAAYLFSSLGKMADPQRLTLKLSGDNVDWQGEAFALIVGNSAQAGGMVLSPDSRLDDGLVEVMVIQANVSQGRFETLKELLRGRGMSADKEVVYHTRTRDLEFEANQPFVVNLDGEPREITQATRVEVLPGALRVNLPEYCPLLHETGSPG